eukprot:m.54766 g.54766  ORF g.54766 m.54766 type:complete len:632 (-) comp6867_c0_seq1:4690-6585(-)
MASHRSAAHIAAELVESGGKGCKAALRAAKTVADAGAMRSAIAAALQTLQGGDDNAAQRATMLIPLLAPASPALRDGVADALPAWLPLLVARLDRLCSSSNSSSGGSVTGGTALRDATRAALCVVQTMGSEVVAFAATPAGEPCVSRMFGALAGLVEHANTVPKEVSKFAGQALAFFIQLVETPAALATVQAAACLLFPDLLPLPADANLPRWLRSLDPDACRAAGLPAFLVRCRGFVCGFSTDALLSPPPKQPQTQSLLLTLFFPALMSRCSGALPDHEIRYLASHTLVDWAQAALRCTRAHPERVFAGHGTRPFAAEGSIVTGLLNFVWAHWEDPVERIRHHCCALFEALIALHAAQQEFYASDAALLEQPLHELLADHLLRMPWYLKGRYGLLRVVLPKLGTAKTFDMCPMIARDLLRCATLNGMSRTAADTYEVMCKMLLEEAPPKDNGQPNPEEAVPVWMSLWFPEFRAVFDKSEPGLHRRLLANWLPSTFKTLPGTSKAMLQSLQDELAISQSANSLRCFMFFGDTHLIVADHSKRVAQCKSSNGRGAQGRKDARSYRGCSHSPRVSNRPSSPRIHLQQRAACRRSDRRGAGTPQNVHLNQHELRCCCSSRGHCLLDQAHDCSPV